MPAAEVLQRYKPRQKFKKLIGHANEIVENLLHKTTKPLQIADFQEEVKEASGIRVSSY